MCDADILIKPLSLCGKEFSKRQLKTLWRRCGERQERLVPRFPHPATARPAPRSIDGLCVKQQRGRPHRPPSPGTAPHTAARSCRLPVPTGAPAPALPPSPTPAQDARICRWHLNAAQQETRFRQEAAASQALVESQCERACACMFTRVCRGSKEDSQERFPFLQPTSYRMNQLAWGATGTSLTSF